MQKFTRVMCEYVSQTPNGPAVEQMGRAISFSHFSLLPANFLASLYIITVVVVAAAAVAVICQDFLSLPIEIYCSKWRLLRWQLHSDRSLSGSSMRDLAIVCVSVGFCRSPQPWIVMI